MKKNWKLIQEIFEFLTLSKDCKTSCSTLLISMADKYDLQLVDYHLSLLEDIKSIELTYENVSEEIDIYTDWEYTEYDKIKYDCWGVPKTGCYLNVKHCCITWLGIEMLDVLKKMEEEGVSLNELNTAHPTIMKYINPLIREGHCGV